MKKLAMILAALLLCAAPALADGENDGDSVYRMLAEDGRGLTSRAGRIFEGDEYISSDNQLYRVIAVDDVNMTAVARHMGAEPASINPGYRLVSGNAAYADGEGSIAMYSTHSDESYEPTDGTSSKTENAGIFDVGNALKENLEALGVKVEYSEETFLPHDSGAYSRSRSTAEELLKDSPDALIDIHRDGIPDKSEYETEIDGQETSKVRLLVGRSNPNADANRAFAKELKAAADEMYPGLVKDIFIGKGNYNQELYPQSILLEFGTHTLDKELAISATEKMAEVLNGVLFGGSAKAEGERSEGAAKGVGWLIGACVVAAVIYALAATGRFGWLKEKLSRTASELTGGSVGKKPRE